MGVFCVLVVDLSKTGMHSSKMRIDRQLTIFWQKVCQFHADPFPCRPPLQRQTPSKGRLPCEQTNTCENITLTQAPYVVGNNHLGHLF